MTATTSYRASVPRRLFARLHQGIGWAGHAGLMLGFVAILMVSFGWVGRRGPIRPSDSLPSPSAPRTAQQMPAEPARFVAADLAPDSDIPLLVTQVEHAALAQGLAWGAAEFRRVPATPQRPASLEIACTLKGSYPRLRRALAQMLVTVPGLTLGPLTMSRPASDVVDVEAKLALTVFLADEDAASTPRQAAP